MSSKHSPDNNPKGHEFLQNILSTRGQSSVKESSTSKADNTLNSEDDSAKIKSVLEVDKKIENPLAPNAPRDKEPAAENKKVEVVDKSKIINSRASKAPAFKKEKRAKKAKDSLSETEFEKVKPHTENMTKGTEVVDKERRNKRIVQSTLSVLAIFSVVFLSVVAYNVITQSQKPETPNLLQVEENTLDISKEPQKTIMYQIAEEENPDFLSLVSKEDRVVFAKDGLIVNSEKSTAFEFKDYTLNNTNYCEMLNETDFCYVAEVISDIETSVGNVYAFKNIFQNQFFNEFENPVEKEVPGFKYAATADVKVAGKQAYAIILGQESGLGYGIVSDESIQRDNLLEAISTNR